MEGDVPARKTGRPAKIEGEKPTREKIFDAAVDLFAERGYDRTSVRDIAAATGITESAVYRHYPSKESILEAIFGYTESRVYTPLPPARGNGESPGSSIFREMLEGLPAFLIADPRLIKIVHILFIEMHRNEKIRTYMKNEYGERADDYTAEIFRKQIEDGRIIPCDPHALAQVFNAFRFAWLFQTFILDPDNFGDLRKIQQDLDAPLRLFEHFLVRK